MKNIICSFLLLFTSLLWANSAAQKSENKNNCVSCEKKHGNDLVQSIDRQINPMKDITNYLVRPGKTTSCEEIVRHLGVTNVDTKIDLKGIEACAMIDDMMIGLKGVKTVKEDTGIYYSKLITAQGLTGIMYGRDSRQTKAPGTDAKEYFEETVCRLLICIEK